MAFDVRFLSQVTNHYQTEDAYEFLDGGVLAITYADPSKRSEYYASGQWQQVIADNQHEPGAARSGRATMA